MLVVVVVVVVVVVLAVVLLVMIIEGISIVQGGIWRTVRTILLSLSQLMAQAHALIEQDTKNPKGSHLAARKTEILIGGKVIRVNLTKNVFKLT